MWIVHVLPVARSAPHRELTYFAKERVPEGSIVRLKLRAKSAFGLVLRAEPASEGRQVIRKGSFPLQKVSPAGAGAPFSRTYLRTVFESANAHAVPAGAVLFDAAPAAILSAAAKLPQQELAEESKPEFANEVLILTSPLLERIREYKTLTRESLARGKSVYILTPTKLEAERLHNEIKRGIEDRAVLFHGDLTPKEMRARFADAVRSEYPLLIIGTPSALSIPREDIGTVIVERETSRSYERDERPHLSYVRFADHFAKNAGARFILAATVPSMTTMARKLRHEASEYGIAHGRLEGPPPVIVDTGKKKEERRAFDPIPPEIHALIRDALVAKTPLFLVAARRGLAPLTVCDDCGAVLVCKACGTSLILHLGGARRFLCHYCGQEEEASVRCRRCDSWRLTTLGIGIERVAESFRKTYGQDVVIASGDTLRSKDIPALIERFLSGEVPVIIGTELLVPYLPDAAASIGVVSVDSFLGVPEYTSSERVFNLLAELRSKARERFVIATRQPRNPAIRAIEGGISQFYKDELEERERFGYPPHGTLVRVTLSGRGESFARLLRETEGLLATYGPTVLEARPKLKGTRRAHIIMKLPGSAVDPKLVRLLRNLPPSAAVRINPQRLVSD